MAVNPRLNQFLVTYVTAITLCLAPFNLWIPFSSATTLTERPTRVERDAIGNGVELRVLPIGDSITWGAQSSSSNGYRNQLHDKLTARGNVVDFVGSIVSGTMVDNQHEGHRGKVIDEISDMSYVGMSAGPNIVLLHAGTNDMNQDRDVGNAPRRLENLINKILDSSPTAAIFVCQIVPAKDSVLQARIDTFNAAIPDIVARFVNGGYRLTLVDMRVLTLDDVQDVLHPNDQGYSKMADVYYSAIESADSKGWITAVADLNGVAPEVGEPLPTLGTIAAATKLVTSDGSLVQSWVKWGVVMLSCTLLISAMTVSWAMPV